VKRLARVDLAVYSRQMFRQSTWFGTVCALVAIFIALNCLPPVEVRYEISGKVLLQSQRVEGLVGNLQRSTDVAQPVRLHDFQVLDRSDLSLGSQPNFAREPLVSSGFDSARVLLLNVKSLWNQQCEFDEFASWLEQITRPQVPKTKQSDLSKALRLARWELSAARHYVAQHQFLSDSSRKSAQKSEVATLERPSEPAPFQLVGTEAARLASDAASENVDPDVFETDPLVTQRGLEVKVAEAKAKLDELERQFQAGVAKSLGAVQITDSLKVRPIASRIPFWMAASVIVLGLAVGSSAAWFHRRLQSGGIYDPNQVAEQLAAIGLKVVSRIQLPADQIDSADWLELAGQQASGAGRRTARHLILVAEGCLAFWLVLIVARGLFDPLWRFMLLDSPLAAFGRLVSGMP
jgi:hypothetical protein